MVRSVAPRPRLDSHRLIEEFMVIANVAAAEELERLHQPTMYRVHAPPSKVLCWADAELFLARQAQNLRRHAERRTDF